MDTEMICKRAEQLGKRAEQLKSRISVFKYGVLLVLPNLPSCPLSLLSGG